MAPLNPAPTYIDGVDRARLAAVDTVPPACSVRAPSRPAATSISAASSMPAWTPSSNGVGLSPVSPVFAPMGEGLGITVPVHLTPEGS